MRRYRRVSLAATAGLLLLLAFPSYGLWWTAPLGLAALLLAVDGTSLRRAWLLGLLAYLVLFLPLLEWVRFLGVGPWLALAVLQAALAGLLAPALLLVLRRRHLPLPVRVLGLVGAVVAVEAVRARVPFGGLTWGRLAFSQSEGLLLPWAPLGGAPLVGAMVAVAVAVAVAVVGVGELLRRSSTADRRAGAAVLMLAPAAAAMAVPLPVDGPTVQVAAAQGNVPVRRRGVRRGPGGAGHPPGADRAARRRGARRHPPSSGPGDLAGERLRPGPAQRAAEQAAARAGQARTEPAVPARRRPGRGRPADQQRAAGVGARRRAGRDLPQAPPRAVRRVPAPARPGGAPLPGCVDAAGTRLHRRRRRRPAAPLGVPLAVGTCFEVAFDELPRQAVRAGGQLLVLPSNNASYGRSAQSAQQLAMARLRAVEHGRATVVATTSGISALIAPDGRVLSRSGLYEPAVLQSALPRRTALTLATTWGGWIVVLLVALLLPSVLAGRRAGPRPRVVAGGAVAPHGCVIVCSR